MPEKENRNPKSVAMCLMVCDESKDLVQVVISKEEVRSKVQQCLQLSV